MTPIEMTIEPPAALPADQVPAQRQGLGTRLVDLVLTTDFMQRRSLKLVLMTAMVYAVCVALMAYGVQAKIFDPRQTAILATLCILANIVFYVTVRCGLNHRFAEPTLAFPQILVAETLLVGGYSLGGVMHGAILIMFTLPQVFGMLNLSVRNSRWVSVYTISLLGLVMIWRIKTDPLIYSPKLELIYFAMAGAVLPAISQLSIKLMTMRARLKDQKAALEQALAHIQEMATHDELTGLDNRRSITAKLAEHVMRRKRGGTPFYLAMVDLDHFKRVNDTHGHATGDEVLRAFAQQACTVLRNTDVVARWGGEEFLLLLPEAPPGAPMVGVERLRASLASTQVCTAAPELRVAFSAGLTKYQEGETIDQAIERADRALYAAKSAGRNQTVVL